MQSKRTGAAPALSDRFPALYSAVFVRPQEAGSQAKDSQSTHFVSVGCASCVPTRIRSSAQ
jgi:hypothetical protein